MASNYHNLPPTVELDYLLDSEIGKVYFYGNFVILEINQGVNLNYRSGIKLLVKGLQIMGRKKFMIISNRKNSYSLDPNDYVFLQNIPTLKGIALVLYHDYPDHVEKLEASFFKKPMKAFNSLTVAYEWCQEVMAEENIVI